jgi:hypothetical protein
MEPNNPSVQDPEPFEKPDPTDPSTWIELTKRFAANSKGQEIALRISGLNEAAVREFAEKVDVRLDIVPVVEKGADPSQWQAEKWDDLMDVDPTTGERNKELDLEISVEIENAAGVEPPYEVHFQVDPPISGGVLHSYNIANGAVSVNVTVSASTNSVSASLMSGGSQLMGGQAGTGPGGGTAFLSGSSAQPTSFTLRIAGIDPENEYTYSCSATFV